MRTNVLEKIQVKWCWSSYWNFLVLKRTYEFKQAETEDIWTKPMSNWKIPGFWDTPKLLAKLVPQLLHDAENVARNLCTYCYSNASFIFSDVPRSPRKLVLILKCTQISSSQIQNEDPSFVRLVKANAQKRKNLNKYLLK